MLDLAIDMVTLATGGLLRTRLDDCAVRVQEALMDALSG